MKNQLKIIKKSIKNRSKIIPGGVLERLGTVLGRPRGLDPVFRVSWSRLGAVPGASWGVLEVFWRRLGSQLGFRNGAKIAKRSIPKSIIFVDASWDGSF